MTCISIFIGNFLQFTVENKVKTVDTNYRLLYTTPTFDYCSYRRGASKNPLFLSLMDQLKTSPNVFKNCPFHTKLEVRNLDVKDEKFYSIYPSGDYREVSHLSDENQTKALTLTIDYTINCPNKFG